MGNALLLPGGDAQVSRASPLSRLSNSVSGAVLGLILYVATVALIAWNEGDYVSQKAVLASAESAVETFACNDTRMARGGHALVFLQGCALANLPLWSDSSNFDFGEDSRGAWMATTLEMWQWKEALTQSPRHCDQPSYSSSCRVRGCTAGYIFPDSTLDPPSTGACNPSTMPSTPAGGKRLAADGVVSAGAVTLNRAQIQQMASSRPLMPHNAPLSLEYDVALPVATLTPENARLSSNGVTTVRQGSAPRIGDVEASFAIAAATEVTLLAAVNAQGMMVPWRSQVESATGGASGSGTSINRLAEGSISLEDLLLAMHDELEERVWGLRLLCLLLSCLSLFLVLSPAAAAPRTCLPCIGQLIGELAGSVVCCASLLLGLSTFLITTALCWLWFRPAVALPLLLIAALLIAFLVRLRRRRGMMHHAAVAGGFAGRGREGFLAQQQLLPFGVAPSSHTVGGRAGGASSYHHDEGSGCCYPSLGSSAGMAPAGGCCAQQGMVIPQAVAVAVPMGQPVQMDEAVPTGQPVPPLGHSVA
jgi:hypothetical protein